MGRSRKNCRKCESGKMKIKEKFGKTIRTARNILYGTVITAPFLFIGGFMIDACTAPFRGLASIPLHGINIGVRAVAEAIENKHPEIYTAKVKYIGYTRMAQTKGVLYWADIELPDGHKFKVYDSQRILEGKLVPNSVIPTFEDMEGRLAWYQKSACGVDDVFLGGSKEGLKVGKDYNFRVVGNTLVDAVKE